MQGLVVVVCYVLSAVCFAVATFQHKLCPGMLDMIAVGLFFFAVSQLVESLD